MPSSIRTLVVHVGGIGDFLLACPAVRHLSSEGPVELLGQVSRLTLAVEAGLADQAHDLDAVAFHTIAHDPSPVLRQFLARFDRAIVWMKDAQDIAEGLRSCGVREVHTFPGLPPAAWRRHASCYYLECLGLPESEPLRLAIPPSSDARDVIIHCGSGGVKKNWPRDCFEAVAHAIQAKGRTVTWCLGPAEDAVRLPADYDLLQCDSLVELARALAAAKLFLGNDCGITHLAAAVGCPTVAIFGVTAPRVWAPLGGHVRAICGSPWPDTAAALEAVRSLQPAPD